MILFSGCPLWQPDYPRTHPGPALLHHASGHDRGNFLILYPIQGMPTNNKQVYKPPFWGMTALSDRCRIGGYRKMGVDISVRFEGLRREGNGNVAGKITLRVSGNILGQNFDIPVDA